MNKRCRLTSEQFFGSELVMANNERKMNIREEMPENVTGMRIVEETPLSEK